jgi:hypothetical protein
MPRIRTGVEPRERRTGSDLIDRLADELKNNRESGQPIIYKTELPNDKLRVTVVWDNWDRLPLEDRTEIILEAYGRAEERGAAERVALASGVTVPEAYSAGMLPFQIITALRRDDPVTSEQCREAMIEEGASTLLGSDKPLLRFATLEEAERARMSLSQRLPNSEPVWVIAQDLARVEDWSHH